MVNENTNIDFVNDKQTIKLFNELAKVHQNQVINKALRQAAQPIKEKVFTAFKSKYKSSTNYKNLRTAFKISPMKSKTGIKIGIINYKYRFLEFGTKDRFYKTSTKGNIFKRKQVTKHFTGKIQASNFFYNSVNATKEQAQSKVSSAIIESLNQVVNKLSAK